MGKVSNVQKESRSGFWLNILCLAFLSACSTSARSEHEFGAQQPSNDQPPSLWKQRFDFGKVPQNSRSEHLFVIRNDLDAHLIVSRMELSCNCLKPILLQREVPSRGTLSVNALFAAKVGRVGKRTSQIKLHLSKPDGSEIVALLELVATVLPPYSLIYNPNQRVDRELTDATVSLNLRDNFGAGFENLNIVSHSSDLKLSAIRYDGDIGSINATVDMSTSHDLKTVSFSIEDPEGSRTTYPLNIERSCNLIAIPNRIVLRQTDDGYWQDSIKVVAREQSPIDDLTIDFSTTLREMKATVNRRRISSRVWELLISVNSGEFPENETLFVTASKSRLQVPVRVQ